MNEDPRVQAFRDLLARTDAARSAPSPEGRYAVYGALLVEWVELLIGCGMAALLLHRAAAEAVDFGNPPDHAGTEDDLMRALALVSSHGRAERKGFLDAVGRLMMDLHGLVPPRVAALLAGDVHRLRNGEPPQVLVECETRLRGNAAGDPVRSLAEARLVLRLEYEMGLADCGLGRLLNKPEMRHLGLTQRTVESWQRAVPAEERRKARDLGRQIANGVPPADKDRMLHDDVTHYSLEDMVKGHGRMRAPIKGRRR